MDGAGRIWVGWDTSIVKAQVIRCSSQYVFLESGGAEVIPSNYKEFYDCTQDAHIFDLRYTGCFFTWNNKQEGEYKIASKIDRIMVNMEWIEAFYDSTADFLLPGISYYSPGVVSIFEGRYHGPPPYKFCSFWVNEPYFMSIVRKSWMEPMHGNPMMVLVNKLKRLKKVLILWKNERFKRFSEQLLTAKSSMDEVQRQLQAQPLRNDLVVKEKEVVKTYAKLARCEESINKEKSKVQWMEAGDLNTRFFHNSLKERRSKNNILVLNSREDIKLEDVKLIGEECVNFFSEFFSGNSNQGDIQETGKLVKEVNSTRFTFVAKCENASTVFDFRPISCCNVIYKCLTKFLSSRMKFILKGLISSSQSAFISGRSIQDYILLAHEIVRNYHKSGGSPRCSLKIDLQKAYDTVSSDVIAAVMRKFGFPEIFIDWVMVCISTAKFSVMINGSPYGFFGAQRGVRQGCPMFPYLFVMVLSKVIKDSSGFSGLDVNYNKTSLFSSSVEAGFLEDISCCLNFYKGELPVSWSQICTVEGARGIGVKDLEQTNITANLRHIWDINSGKNTIWTQWIHTNLIKQRDFWTLVVPKDCSWRWRRILEFRDTAKQFMGTFLGNGEKTSLYYGFWHPKGRLCDWMEVECLETICPDKELTVADYMVDGFLNFPECNHEPHCDGKDILQGVDYDFGDEDLVLWKGRKNGDFSMKETFRALSGDIIEVGWTKLVWFKNNIPRHSFISWLACHKRLKTKAKLQRWGLVNNAACALCGGGIEHEEHLFLTCSFSSIIWKGLLIKLGIFRNIASTRDEELL
ncbi:uncharacterized protein LOC113272885 [Papaver somniferum]|uniref:uncharacterized protein LOC113272885 n=1 Tax=Papaver somniferum TaxID=3469 RepID=UPI000E6FA3EC|nr:uncharacterized protein LOC113272885 [Papaver somniferum]